MSSHKALSLQIYDFFLSFFVAYSCKLLSGQMPRIQFNANSLEVSNS